jgi:predicted ester cyclase
MSTEDNIIAFRKLIDVGFTQGNLDVVEELVSTAAIEHQRGSKPGIDGVKATINILHEWFSDFELTVVKLATDGDTVWAINRARGVNTGSIFGNPPTGKSFEIDVMDIARFTDGKLVEHWGVPDQLGLLMQLGLAPGPQPVGAERSPFSTRTA